MTDDEIKYALSKISINELTTKIETYRNFDFSKISDEDLFNEILNVLLIDVDGLKKAIMLPRFNSYPKGTRFYRVRTISSEDNNVPLDSMKVESDAWNPPEKFVTTIGRLNKINESLLYTSPIEPYIAIQEIKVPDNEKFSLIVYEAKKEIKVCMVGIWEDIPFLNENENLKMRIMYNFLKDEFKRDVGIGTEYLYRASENITKVHFTFPRHMQDAWCYPSVAYQGAVNVCFQPEIAKELLNLVGVLICKVKRNEVGHEIKCIGIASGFNNDDIFNYYAFDREAWKDKFPEFK